MSAYLRLRWEPETKTVFRCHYELVIPLGEHDIRREVYKDGEMVGTRTEIVIAMNEGSVRRSGGGIPCMNDNGDLFYDAPYRDGAHAMWDSEVLGNIPIKVMTIHGKLIEKD